MSADGKKHLYVGLTLRGRIAPADWRFYVKAVEAALEKAPEVKITAISVSVGDDQVLSERR